MATKNHVLVTGGAGFIGIHLCHHLLDQGHSIAILDNFAAPSAKQSIQSLLQHNSYVEVIQGDCTNPQHVTKALTNANTVFHLAADPEIRLDRTTTQNLYTQNLHATHTLLEQIKDNPRIQTVIFTSTSTVYGDAKTKPTSENYTIAHPISVYGATKLASEALITAYAYIYRKKAIILRLANVVGSHSHRGVIYDFIQKLCRNPHRLEILGDGTQTKSYLHITDCLNAIQTAWQAKKQIETYNISSEDQITVTEIAHIIIEEMGLENVDFHYTGGVDGGRGWKGDVKNMLLDVSRLKAKGWLPRYNSVEAVRKAVQELLSEHQDIQALPSEMTQQQVA